MAAQTITNNIAPRLEFYSPDGNGVRVRLYDTKGNIAYEHCISTATWLAMTGAALTGASPSISNGGAGGIVYLPKNVGPSPFSDGRSVSGGHVNPVAWAGTA